MTTKIARDPWPCAGGCGVLLTQSGPGMPRKRCASCAYDARLAWWREYMLKRTSRGLCRCGARPAIGYKCCNACLVKARAAHARHMEACR